MINKYIDKEKAKLDVTCIFWLNLFKRKMKFSINFISNITEEENTCNDYVQVSKG